MVNEMTILYMTITTQFTDVGLTECNVVTNENQAHIMLYVHVATL